MVFSPYAEAPPTGEVLHFEYSVAGVKNCLMMLKFGHFVAFNGFYQQTEAQNQEHFFSHTCIFSTRKEREKCDFRALLAGQKNILKIGKKS